MATSPSNSDTPFAEDSPSLKHARGLAELAFGSFTRTVASAQTLHLAQMAAETLELDLNDPAQRQFGDYELLELLGEGGMGVVYRARQASLDRDVAVKLLSAGPWASKEFIARFEREAQNAARMQHPAIVTVYEVGSFEGLPFFSMRLVRGESLSACLKRGGKFTPREAAALTHTIAEAVGYAHSLGVLHLDLKPANVLLDEIGQPYVADFGLARRLENALAVDNEEISGTPAYMAPEQAQVRAHKLTAATDIWGLGAILYELLTGRPPFRGDSAQATVNLVLQGRVRAPRRWVPALPLDLQAIVMRCLDREPSRRYSSARALADDLARFVEGRPVQARPLNGMQRVARWTRREPRLAATLACAILALVIGLIATTWQSHRATQSALLARHTLWNARTATAQKQIAAGDAYRAIANTVANLRDMEAAGDRKDAALERLRIGTVLANAPVPIDVFKLSGKDNFANALAISPDAKTIAVATDRVVHLLDIASGKELWRVDTRDRSFGVAEIHNDPIDLLRFSTDGRRLLAYMISYYPGGAWSTMVPHQIDNVMIDVAAGKVVDPPKTFADFLATDYAEGGRYALLFDKHGRAQRWRTQPWAPDGGLVELAGNFDDAVTAGPLLGEALLARNGETAVLVSNANLVFRTLDGEHLRSRHTLALTTAQGRATAWALDHASRQLAIGTMTGQVGLWNLDSGEMTWLPQPQVSGRIAVLRFSADDSRLLAVSREPSELRVFDPRSHALIALPVALSDVHAPDSDTGIDAQFGADARTLVTQHWAGSGTLWQLPEPGFPPQPPVIIAPILDGRGTRFALAHDARSRLMASSDNGQVKVWRLRPSPLTNRVAAPMVADTLRFDGHHLVSAEGNRVSVFDVGTDQSVGKTIVLPEAPTYAGLDGSGTRLIAIAGRELSCWNWRDGKPCWPAIALPDSALRLSLAAHAPMLAVSTGSNDHGQFFGDVRLVDLATGRQRGAPVVLRGPLGTLRLSDNGRRLLAWQDTQSVDAEAEVLYVIDTANAKIVQRLQHHGRRQSTVYDARFMADGSIWSHSNRPWNSTTGPDSFFWHWSVDGRLLLKTSQYSWTGFLALPDSRGIVDLEVPQIILPGGKTIQLNATDSYERNEAGAVSADGKLLALATINGVALTDLGSNQRLLPDFKLPLPFHDMVQQLAFSPDGTRLVGRTAYGRWFQWPLPVDARPVAAIERDVRMRDLGPRDDEPSALSGDARRQLRAADPGSARAEATTSRDVANATVASPVADPRFIPLDLAPIANVDPREPMNHATRLPPQPQSLPSLPRGLQRYDGVDFLLGRAVQLSGTPRNLLDTEFPSTSRALGIGGRRFVAIDALVMQYIAATGAAGSVTLHYADGGERELDIASPRDVLAQWTDATTDPGPRRVGWLGSFPAQSLIDGGDANAEETFTRSYIVRLVNPEPGRPVASISLGAPPAASPGLLFLALTLEPGGAERVPPAGKR